MAPADSASRAGAMPKASGDRSSRTLDKKNMAHPNSVFTASSKGCTAIASGTLIPLDPLQFIIGIPNLANDEHNLRVNVTLERDETDSKSLSQLTGDSEDNKLIHLRIVNLESPLGGGPAQPLELWRSPTDVILLQLRIYTQGSSAPTVHFTFYSQPLEEAK